MYIDYDKLRSLLGPGAWENIFQLQRTDAVGQEFISKRTNAIKKPATLKRIPIKDRKIAPQMRTELLRSM